MTLPRSIPVSAFNPGLLRLLIKGGLTELVIDFTKPTTKAPEGLDRKAAARLAARTQIQLYHLRSRMKAEKHPDLDTAYRAEVSRPQLTPWILIVRPRDNTIASYLDEAVSLAHQTSEAGGLAEADINELLDEIPEAPAS
jgi:hypothetical protein